MVVACTCVSADHAFRSFAVEFAFQDLHETVTAGGWKRMWPRWVWSQFTRCVVGAVLELFAQHPAALCVAYHSLVSDKRRVGIEPRKG